MAKPVSPTMIKKYANRRLYNTGTSTYVTLEDLAVMIKAGEDFLVVDAKTNEDITRSVLTQIIFEQEGKSGAQLLPVDFLRQLIRFYGDSMQTLVPGYLQMSLESFVKEQEKFRETMTKRFADVWPANPFLGMFEDQVRKNIEVFGGTLKMFSPFPAERSEADAAGSGDIDRLRSAMKDMQAKLDRLAGGK